MTSSLPHSSAAYHLIDFGYGRKLEQFGASIVDRPSPPAERKKRSLDVDLWQSADIRFDQNNGKTGAWFDKNDKLVTPDSWNVGFKFATFQMNCSPVGHLGIFPEQQSNWDWIRENENLLRGQEVLNLFAYTGGSTLAAASVGAKVTHVDSAKNIVQRARYNAAQSDLADSPIRWIVDDVQKFVQREIKRKKQYRAVFLDPPSYGHGAKNETWKIERDFEELLANCKHLLHDTSVVLLTCHSPGYDAAHLGHLCSNLLKHQTLTTRETGSMDLQCRQGRHLSSGYYARFVTK